MVDPKPKSVQEPAPGVDPLYDRMAAVFAEWWDTSKWKKHWWADELHLLMVERKNWDDDILTELVGLFEALAFELSEGLSINKYDEKSMVVLNTYRTQIYDLRALRNRRKLAQGGPDIFILKEERKVPINEEGAALVPRNVVKNMNEAANPWGRG
mgnify:CR=1 FL=1